MRKLLAGLLFGFLLLALPAAAEPVQVSVGSYIINVGEYNIDTGSYIADFYLWLNWNDTSIEPDFDSSSTRSPFERPSRSRSSGCMKAGL